MNGAALAWICYDYDVNNCMMPDLTPYSAILNNEKWISKIDFIYRIKSQFDSSEDRNKHLLQLLYRLNFHQVKKDNAGKILFQ